MLEIGDLVRVIKYHPDFFNKVFQITNFRLTYNGRKEVIVNTGIAFFETDVELAREIRVGDRVRIASNNGSYSGRIVEVTRISLYHCYVQFAMSKNYYDYALSNVILVSADRELSLHPLADYVGDDSNIFKDTNKEVTFQNQNQVAKLNCNSIVSRIKLLISGCLFSPFLLFQKLKLEGRRFRKDLNSFDPFRVALWVFLLIAYCVVLEISYFQEVWWNEEKIAAQVQGPHYIPIPQDPREAALLEKRKKLQEQKKWK